MEIDMGVVAAVIGALGSGGVGAGVTRWLTARQQRQTAQVQLDGQLAPGLIEKVEALHQRIDEREETITFLKAEADECRRSHEECTERVAQLSAEVHVRQAQFLETLGALAGEMATMEKSHGKGVSRALERTRRAISDQAIPAQGTYAASDTIPAPTDDEEAEQ